MEGRSTTGALVVASNPHDVCAVFLDLSKAFLHRPLLAKLEELGVDQHIVCWIVNYLLQRSQYVVVNGERSLSSPVVSSVPQGSVLGPLLLVYINDVSKQVHIFADDILMHLEIGWTLSIFLLSASV